MPTRADWAGWLAAHPDNDPTSGRIRHVQAIEAHGAEVLALPADVADEAQMRAALAQAQARFGPIHGVIHAAGVAGGGMIQLKTPELAERVLAPKLRGTAVLEAIFSDTKLDFLVLCSSVSALTGGVGQVDYCAANIFLDAFALSRSAGRGTRILSINWDRWRNVGMARIAEELHRSLTGMELADGLPTEQAAEAFRRALMSSTSPQIAVTLYDLPAIVEQMMASSVSQLLEGLGHAQVARIVHTRPALGTTYVPPRQPTETLLAGAWQELLGFEPVGIHDNFFEAGGHSLLATQVLSRVRDALHVQLPLHAIFDAPTVAELAAVIDQVREEQQESSKLDQILREIEAISADDARVILSHEMGQEAERPGS